MRQDFVDLITEENVIYLQTFKLLKSYIPEYVRYKNKYLRLPKEFKEAEKNRIQSTLEQFPNSAIYGLYSIAIKEVDNG